MKKNLTVWALLLCGLLTGLSWAQERTNREISPRHQLQKENHENHLKVANLFLKNSISPTKPTVSDFQTKQGIGVTNLFPQLPPRSMADPRKALPSEDEAVVFVGATYSQQNTIPVRVALHGTSVTEIGMVDFPFKGQYSETLFPVFGSWTGETYLSMWAGTNPYWGGNTVYGVFGLNPQSGEAINYEISMDDLGSIANAYSSAYSYKDNKMYILGPEFDEAMEQLLGYNLFLLNIVKDSAKVEKVSTIQGMPENHFLITIAINKEGQMFGIGSDGILYSIEETNGTVTNIGSTGISVLNSEGQYYSQSATFSYESDKLYWAYIQGTDNEIGLGIVDISNGSLEKVTTEFVQLTAMSSVYYQEAAPKMVENLKITYNDGKISASFKTPLYDINEKPLTSLASATLYQRDGSQWTQKEQITTVEPGQEYTINHTTTSTGLQRFGVSITDSKGLSSDIIDMEVALLSVSLPYSNGFEASETEAMEAILASDPLLTGGIERTQTQAYEGEWSYQFTSNYSEDGRMLSIIGLPVEKGSGYQISLYAKTLEDNWDNLYYTLNKDFNNVAQTQMSPSWTRIEKTFVADVSGSITFDMMGLNESNPFFIDNISVKKISEASAPSLLSINRAEPASEGVMNLEVNITLPETTMGNESLSSLQGIIYEYSTSESFQEYLSDTLTQNLTPGETVDLILPIQEPGSFFLRARAFNENGACPTPAYYGYGPYLVETGFVGVDQIEIPGIQTSLSGNGEITLQWKPAEGVHGGYVGTPDYELTATSKDDGNIYSDFGSANWDEESGKYSITVRGLKPDLYIFSLKASSEIAESQATEIYSLAGYQDYAWIHNSSPEMYTESSVLFVSSEDDNSGLSQTIYPAPGRAMYIDTLTMFYDGELDQEASQRTKIYMGTTDMEHYTGGYLNKPDFVEKDQLTLVYDGELVFTPGKSALKIPLKGFYYPGEGNIVVTFIKPMQEATTGSISALTGDTEFAMLKFEEARTDVDFDTATSFNQFGTMRAKFYAPVSTATENKDLGTLNITVKDLTENTPVEGASVIIQDASDNTGLSINVQLQTDAEGKVSFAYLPKGKFQVKVQKAGYTESKPITFEIEGKETVVDKTIELLQATLVQVTGNITDVKGKALANVIVSAKGIAEFSDTTNSEGKFHLKDIYGPDSYRVTLSKDGMKTKEINFEIGEKDSSVHWTMDFIPLPVTMASASINQEGEASIQWSAPASISMISWTPEGEGYNKLTVDKKQAFRFAQRFTPEDLKELGLNQAIPMQMGFVPSSALAEYSLVICQDTTEEIFRQKIDSRQIKEMEWLYIPITKDLDLDMEKELWLIVEVAESQEQGYACTVTKDGEVPGKGNLIEYNNRWHEVSELFATTNGNVLIALQVREKGSEVSPINGYQVYRGEKGKDFESFTLLNQEPVSETSYTDEGYSKLPFGQYQYAVVADWSGPETENLSPEVLTNVLNKDMEFDLTVELSSATGSTLGTSIILENDNHKYTALVEKDNRVILNQVWRGEYSLTAKLDYHQTYLASVTVDTTKSIQVKLQENMAAPTILNAAVNGKNARLEFGINTSNWKDDLESYPDFAIGNIGEWISLGSSKKGGIQSGDGTSYTWPNMEEKQGFIVFNDNQVEPASLDWTAYSGEKCLASLYRADEKPNTDIIARKVEGGGKLHFYVRSAESSAPETFSVVYSTTSEVPETSQFKAVDGYENQEAPLSWTLVSVQIPEYAKWVGVQHTTSYSFALLVDDLRYETEAPSRPKGYEVFLNGKSVKEISAEEKSFVFEDLETGKHELGVAAIYAGGKSEITKTNITISQYPIPVELDVITDGNKATFQWKKANGSDPKTYKVYLDDILVKEDLTDTSYVFENLKNGKHTASVVAVYAGGESEKASIDFEIKGTGNQHINMDAARIYPNPIREYGILELPFSCDVEIFSVSGKSVFHQKMPVGKHHIDFHSYAKGIYLVRLSQGSEATLFKVVIL